MKQILSILLALTLFFGVSAPQIGRASAIEVEVNGALLDFDQPPILENDRVLVPARALFEALGAEVGWNASERVVTSQKDGETLLLQIGNPIMLRSKQIIILDAAPRILNDRTLVPLRAVSEGHSAQVDWDASSRKVTVTTTAAEDAPQTPQTPQVPDTPQVPEEEAPSQPENPASSFAYRVFELTNEERTAAGLPPFVWDDSLAQVAYAHSKDMGVRGFFDHTNPDGLSPFDRIKNAGISYSRAAENIAAGQTSPEAVVRSWMNSSGHRANILNPNLTTLGVGYYEGSGSYGTYWTQCFIAK